MFLHRISSKNVAHTENINRSTFKVKVFSGSNTDKLFVDRKTCCITKNSHLLDFFLCKDIHMLTWWTVKPASLARTLFNFKLGLAHSLKVSWSRCEALGVSLGNLLVLGGVLVLVLVFWGDLDTIFSFSQATYSLANSVKELRCWHDETNEKWALWACCCNRGLYSKFGSNFKFDRLDLTSKSLNWSSKSSSELLSSDVSWQEEWLKRLGRFFSHSLPLNDGNNKWSGRKPKTAKLPLKLTREDSLSVGQTTLDCAIDFGSYSYVILTPVWWLGKCG